MSDQAVRATPLYSGLRALNEELPACEVMAIARDNIARKWIAVQTEHEAEAARQAEAERQAKESRESEASETVLEALETAELDDQDVVVIRVSNGEVVFLLEDEDSTFFLPGEEHQQSREYHELLINRLRVWMRASRIRVNGSWDADHGWSHRGFDSDDVAVLIGCSKQAVTSWLTGNVRCPQDRHRERLNSMMEDHSYAQLRRMVRNGTRVS
jgi:hypothetical protein